MPTYLFHCTSCQVTEELFLKVSDLNNKSLLDCPVCSVGLDPVHNTRYQQLSAVGAILHGSGFYKQGSFISHKETELARDQAIAKAGADPTDIKKQIKDDIELRKDKGDPTAFDNQ